MFPPILTLQPELAKRLLDYRTGNSEAAADLAELSGHEGIRYHFYKKKKTLNAIV